ncbi:hypothetical protein J31TS3_17170 [Paenibacillus lactis]|nr:hypothetical protein J31TS3_17170 [Paenibacillus lactis]
MVQDRSKPSRQDELMKESLKTWVYTAFYETYDSCPFSLRESPQA